MTDREKVISGLKCHVNLKCHNCPYVDAIHPAYGCHLEELIDDALALLKEQPNIVRCKDCSNWIPGYITDDDDFIPPKCGKYQQMVGHSADDYCSLAERE